MTNADKIRNATDEELASRLHCPYDECHHPDEDDIHCDECILEWLKSEAKE